MSMEPRPKRTVTQKLVPSVITFLVVTGLIWGASAAAIALIRHVLLPVIAVFVGGYLAVHLYRFLGRGE